MEKKERYEIHIYDDICVDLYDNGVLDKSINDTYKLEELLNQQDKELSKLRASYQQVKEENSQLKQQLSEKENTIQAYEKIVEQKDEELGFANRDKIWIVKQLNDPSAYVSLEDYKRIEQRLAEKDKEKNKMICHIGYNNLKYLMANNDWKLLEAHQVKEYNQLRKANQDKISFAVEQLRQVQKYIITDEKDMFGMPYLMKSSYIYDYIDNQIKQLTHQHEDKGE